jgi:hypothetical protein
MTYRLVVDAVLLFPPAPHELEAIACERALLGSSLLALVLFACGKAWPGARLVLALVGLSSASACSILSHHLRRRALWCNTALLILVSVYPLCMCKAVV